MRSAFGSWLIERRVARVALVAALLPLFGVISAGIVVCVAIAKGWREGLIDCLIALVAVLVLTGMTGEGLAQVLFSSVSTWGIALLMGGLAGAFGSLTLPIQILILLGCAGTVGFAVAVADPAAFWGPILATIVEQMRQFGVEMSDAEAVIGLAPMMSGLFAASTIASAIVALMLGCWWAGGCRDTSFRDLFINLRLGVVIGGIAAVAGLAALVGLQPLAGNVLLVAAVGFVFQGLAVLHWHVVVRQLPWWVLIPLYVPIFLGTGLLLMVLLLFAAVGFIDNWYGLRRAGNV